MEITIYSIVIWITAILIASFDLVIFLGSKSLSARFFAVITFMVGLWAASFAFHLSTTSVDVANFMVRVEYALGMFISLGFVIFSKIYPNDVIPSKKLILGLLTIGLVFLYVLVATDLIVYGSFWSMKQDARVWLLHPTIWLYNVVFYLLWIFSLKNIYVRHLTIKDPDRRLSLLYMFYVYLWELSHRG